MIPVLAVPVLTRYDLLHRMLASIDIPVARLLVIDNGGGLAPMPGTVTMTMPGNLGVAASWNLAIKSTPTADWWAIVNHDVRFAPGDLARLTEAMDNGAPLATLAGFAAFGISRACVELVGWFDERFVNAYCEDVDYAYRCRLSGVEVLAIHAAGLIHDTSSTIHSDPQLMAENRRTYPENRAYYKSKWGGDIGEEKFRSPFNRGGPVDEWSLDLERLRRLSWTRPLQSTSYPLASTDLDVAEREVAPCA